MAAKDSVTEFVKESIFSQYDGSAFRETSGLFL